MEARLAALPLALRQQIQALALGSDASAAVSAPVPAPAESDDEASASTPRPFPTTFLHPDPLLPAAASASAAAEAQAYLTVHGRQGGLAGGHTDAGVRGDTAAFIDRSSLAPYPALRAAVDALVPAAAAALTSAGLMAAPPSRSSIQVASYAPGSPGYAKHVDGGPGAPGRLATAVLYLQAGAQGGELVLHPSACCELVVRPAAGRALAWSSSTPHEVRAVKAGPARVAVSAFFYGPATTAAPPPAAARPRPPPAPAPAPAPGRGRIFIAMPAFRDADARWSVHAAFTAAAHPGRLAVGVAWQVDLPADADLLTPVGGAAWPGTVREVRIPADEASGPASARRLAMGLWAGEDYILSVDAHTRFRPAWDELLLRWWTDAVRGGGGGDARLVLTSYPPPHEGWGPAAAFPAHDLRPTLLCADRFGPADGLLRCVGRRLASTHGRAIPSRFYGAGLGFAPAAFFTSVAPYDAWMDGAFFGEEADVWVRAASAGWRAAAPPEAVVSTCYETAAETAGHRRGSAPPRTAGAAAAWAAREAACMRGEQGCDLAAFQARLGSLKSVADVWAEAGVDWVGRSISEAGKWGGLGPDAFAT